MSINVNDAPTAAEIAREEGVVSCRCHVGEFGFEVCAACEALAHEAADADDEPVDLYAGDYFDQEYGDGW